LMRTEKGMEKSIDSSTGRLRRSNKVVATTEKLLVTTIKISNDCHRLVAIRSGW